VGDNAFLGVAAIGATFVILSGGIDLSVGAVVAFTSILIASLVGNGADPFVAISASLLIGALFGTAMGCLIRWFELPPFLVTLAGMFLARGMGFVVHPQSLGIEHPFFLQRITEEFSLRITDRVSLPFTATCYLASSLRHCSLPTTVLSAATSMRWEAMNSQPPLWGCPWDGPRS
jgi:ribose/xylose/arabinose/galactoside ABC-type transport system permease subunit